MKKTDLIVVGELNMDLIFNSITGFPKIGTEIVAEAFEQVLGSSSAIMASNAAALGLTTNFVGVVGNDGFGNNIIKELQQRGVGVDFIKKSEQLKTGITVVMNYDEDRANISYCGAMESLRSSDIPWEQLATHRHFHLSNFFMQKGIQSEVPEIFKKAKELGLTTSLDLQWDPANTWQFDYTSCLPHVDIFMPNEAEIIALTGASDLNLAIEKVLPHCQTLVIKMGSQGSWGVTPKEHIKVAAYTNEKYVDSIGAGDSFNSGFIQAFLEGLPLKECLSQGNLMGAISTSAAGGTGAFNEKKEFEKTKKRIIDSSLRK